MINDMPPDLSMKMPATAVAPVLVSVPARGNASQTVLVIEPNFTGHRWRYAEWAAVAYIEAGFKCVIVTDPANSGHALAKRIASEARPELQIQFVAGPEHERIIALLLAGRRPGVDALAATRGETLKALIPVAGIPMVARVVTTLLATPAIGAIRVMTQDVDPIVAVLPG